MRTLRLSLAGTVILVLLGSAALAQEEVPRASVEVLADHGVIPGEAIPEDAVRLGIARTSIEPGVTGEVGSAQPHEWASLEYVERGSISWTDNDRAVIWRADGATEDLPAGTTASADAGGSRALLQRWGREELHERGARDVRVVCPVGRRQ